MTPVTAIGPGAEVAASAGAPVPPGFEALLDAATTIDSRETQSNRYPGLDPGLSCLCGEETGSRGKPGMTMFDPSEIHSKEASAEAAPPADTSEGWLGELIGLFGGVPTGTGIPSDDAKPAPHRRLDDAEALAAESLEDAPLDVAMVPSAPIVPASLQVANLLIRHPGESRDPIGAEWVPAFAGMTGVKSSNHRIGAPIAASPGETSSLTVPPSPSGNFAGPASADNASRRGIGEAMPAVKGEPGAAPPLLNDAALPVQEPSSSSAAGPALAANATGQQAALPGTAAAPAPAPTTSYQVATASAAAVPTLTPVTVAASGVVAAEFSLSLPRAATRQPRDLREALSDPLPSAAAIAPPVLPAAFVERASPPMFAPASDAVPAVDATVRSQGNSFDLATQSLGALHVALETSDAAMRVHVVAERGATASLIVGQADRLQAAVETGGHRLAALSVDIRDGDTARRPLHWQAPEPAAPRRAATPAAVAARTPDRFA